MVNLFFNSNYYLANNPDVVAAGLHTPEQLWQHYITYGAQERAVLLEQGVITADSAVRQANSWFDVSYYLGNYPDLLAGGITAATALNHYFEYGINEERTFNPTLQPSEFEADTYAADNPDVREYYGIEQDAELTAQDKANLLKHFLAYGYAEGRSGAGEAFEEAVLALNEVDIDFDATEILGTIANDLFVVDLELEPATVIDGLGGIDTVRFTTVDNVQEENAVTLRNIENVVVDGVEVNANVTSKLDSVTLKNTGAADLNFASAVVAGTDDVLNVKVVNANAFEDEDEDLELSGLVVNGFETINIDIQSDSNEGSVFFLSADSMQGATQTVNLTGGDQEGVALLFENEFSPALTDLTIDGSALVGGFHGLLLGEQAANIKHVLIQGSLTAENEFQVFGATEVQSLTVIGGNEQDYFYANEAISTFTGGRGNDVFVFDDAGDAAARIEDGKVTAVDTITDFKKGDVLEASISLTIIQPVTGVSYATLEEWLLQGNNNSALEAGSAFNFGGDAYIVATQAVAGDTSDQVASVDLIKLVGIDATKLLENTGDIILA